MRLQPARSASAYFQAARARSRTCSSGVQVLFDTNFQDQGQVNARLLTQLMA
jgi:hypothetical protein